VDSIPSSQGLTDPDRLREKMSDGVACVIIQTPNFLGLLENVKQMEPVVHSSGALLILVCDPISLGLLRTPAEYNADIAVGEGQVLGNSLNLGGPYLGYFAARQSLVRKMPGRIVAATTDTRGKRGFVMTLQTREQHIRREKATSNICTNQALCALAACVYLSMMGKSGIKKVAQLCLQKSHYAAEQIAGIEGFSLSYASPFFKEFVVDTLVPSSMIISALLKKGIFAGLDLGSINPKMKNRLLVCVTEKRTKEEIDLLVDGLREVS